MIRQLQGHESDLFQRLPALTDDELLARPVERVEKDVGDKLVVKPVVVHLSRRDAVPCDSKLWRVLWVI